MSDEDFKISIKKCFASSCYAPHIFPEQMRTTYHIAIDASDDSGEDKFHLQLYKIHENIFFDSITAASTSQNDILFGRWEKGRRVD